MSSIFVWKIWRNWKTNKVPRTKTTVGEMRSNGLVPCLLKKIVIKNSRLLKYIVRSDQN